MLCEMLSQFPQHVLPLPCNACVNVTSERHQSDEFMRICCRLGAISDTMQWCEKRTKCRKAHLY